MTGPNACVPELCSFAEIQLLAEPAVKWPTSGIPACSGKYRYPTHQEVLDAKVSASDCSSERDGRSKARALGQVRIGVLHSFLFALLIFFQQRHFKDISLNIIRFNKLPDLLIKCAGQS